MSLVAIPIVVAIALIVVPLLVRTIGRNTGYPLALFFAILASIIGTRFASVFDGHSYSWSVPWVSHILPITSGGSSAESSRTISFALRLDALSLFFVLLALGIGTFVFAYSARYLHAGSRSKLLSFYLLMTGFMFAVLLLFLADDVAVLFFAWELVSLASFFLIARAGSAGEAGSMRTLILTFTGGLFLLAGLSLSVITTGTTNLTQIISSPAWQDNPVALMTTAILLALAGFSKAAQIPFHAWLPEAMAADTPVSAFLHAAAVVKAGIYLLLRFSPLMHDQPVWNGLLIVSGMSTAIMAALFATQKTDLKKLTAYSTVSQLGWIVATIGIGTPAALTAAIVHTLAHALFKSSLFMIIGVVDHQANTRDISRLPSLYRAMPLTFIGAAIACASMAGLPPTFGFIAKEGMLSALTEAPGGSWVSIALLISGTIGALLTFLYSGRYLFGAFIDDRRSEERRRKDKNKKELREAPVAFWLPAVIPGVLSIPVVAAISFLDSPLDAMTTVAYGEAEAHTHLSLWHGINIPLLITTFVIVVGCIGIRYRHALSARIENRSLLPFTGADLIASWFTLSMKFGRIVSTMANSYSPDRHLIWIILTFLTIGFGSIFGPSDMDILFTLEPRVPGLDKPTDAIALVIVVAAVGSLSITRSRFASIILVGVAGVGVSWLMLTLGAPDVALTQLLVELLMVVIMMMVLRHQPRLYLREGENRTRLASIVATAVAIITFLGVWILTGRREKPPVGEWYLNHAPEESGGANIVNTILVEFRAFDTMGELIVLGMTGIVIAAIIRSIPRSPLPGYGPGSTSESFRAEGSTRFPDVHKIPELAPFYSRYLRSTYLNSLLGRQLLKPLIPILILLSFLVFMRGHNSPGGGFIAALIGAGTLFMWYLFQAWSRRIGDSDLGFTLIGYGVIIALITGVAGWFGPDGGFLTPIHATIGSYHFTSSIIFDLGVYLSVIGLIVVIINFLSGKERPGYDPAKLRLKPKATPSDGARPAQIKQSTSPLPRRTSITQENAPKEMKK